MGVYDLSVALLIDGGDKCAGDIGVVININIDIATGDAGQYCFCGQIPAAAGIEAAIGESESGI